MKSFSYFVGELGWELFCYQGRLRQMAKKDLTIGCLPGHEIFYEDFCQKFVRFNPEGKRNAFSCEGFKLPKKYQPFYIFGGIFYNDKDTRRWEATPQKFVKYGKYIPNNMFWNYDVLIHPRCIKDSYRNYPYWKEIIDYFDTTNYKIATIGAGDDLEFLGIESFKNIPLDQLCDLMASSKLLLGGSSGIMHLGALCGIKRLVWDTDLNRKRYEKLWNPFNTETTFIGGGYSIDPNLIIEKIKQHGIQN